MNFDGVRLHASNGVIIWLEDFQCRSIVIAHAARNDHLIQIDACVRISVVGEDSGDLMRLIGALRYCVDIKRYVGGNRIRPIQRRDNQARML